MNDHPDQECLLKERAWILKTYVQIIDKDRLFGLVFFTSLFGASWTALEAFGFGGSPGIFISLLFASALGVMGLQTLKVARWNVINWAIDQCIPHISSYNPRVIIGVGRGGAHIAAMLCHKLSEIAGNAISEPYFVSIDRTYFLKDGTITTKIPNLSNLDFKQISEAGKVLLVTAEVRTGNTILAARKLLRKNNIKPKTFSLLTTAFAEYKVDFYVLKANTRSLIPWPMSKVHRQ